MNVSYLTELSTEATRVNLNRLDERWKVYSAGEGWEKGCWDAAKGMSVLGEMEEEEEMGVEGEGGRRGRDKMERKWLDSLVMAETKEEYRW